MTRPLSPRQRQVIEAASRGLTAREIAEELGCAHHTVRTHEAALIRRLGVRNLTEAAVKYERERAATEARDLLRQRIAQEVTAY